MKWILVVAAVGGYGFCTIGLIRAVFNFLRSLEEEDENNG